MNTKLPVYPTIIFACLLGLVGLLLVWLRFSVSIESVPPATSSLPSTELPQPHTPSVVINAVPKLTQPAQQDTRPVSSSELGAVASGEAALRVSNQTQQPLRVALLAQQSANKSGGQHIYGKPAHWDFAPTEGGIKGLILSLPEGNFKLKKRDILVAFAQDGSRRYWGPYVVGETALPVWNHQTGEWNLTLR